MVLTIATILQDAAHDPKRAGLILPAASIRPPWGRWARMGVDSRIITQAPFRPSPS